MPPCIAFPAGAEGVGPQIWPESPVFGASGTGMCPLLLDQTQTRDVLSGESSVFVSQKIRIDPPKGLEIVSHCPGCLSIRNPRSRCRVVLAYETSRPKRAFSRQPDSWRTRIRGALGEDAHWGRKSTGNGRAGGRGQGARRMQAPRGWYVRQRATGRGSRSGHAFSLCPRLGLLVPACGFLFSLSRAPEPFARAPHWRASRTRSRSRTSRLPHVKI